LPWHIRAIDEMTAVLNSRAVCR